MRIVGGRWRGRRIEAPGGTLTRPTSDRVRESIFGIIASRFPDILTDGPVLDAFAGSGALAFEALSRGAPSAVIVDHDPAAIAVIRSNTGSLDADSARIIQGDVFALVHHGLLEGGPFALLFVDPPYRIERAQVRDLLDELVLSESLLDGAVVVYEHDSSGPALWPGSVDAVTERVYGDTGVSIATYTRGD